MSRKRTQEVATLVLYQRHNRGHHQLVYHERRLSLTGDGRLRLNCYEERYRPSHSSLREHSYTVSVQELEHWLEQVGRREGEGD